jgi:hypothetical protein
MAITLLRPVHFGGQPQTTQVGWLAALSGPIVKMRRINDKEYFFVIIGQLRLELECAVLGPASKLIRPSCCNSASRWILFRGEDHAWEMVTLCMGNGDALGDGFVQWALCVRFPVGGQGRTGISGCEPAIAADGPALVGCSE